MNQKGKNVSPLCVKFNESFKTLLRKLLQVGLLNIAEHTPDNKGYNFLKCNKSKSMELFDLYLSDKLNRSVLENLTEIIKPILIAHLNNVRSF